MEYLELSMAAPGRGKAAAGGKVIYYGDTIALEAATSRHKDIEVIRDGATLSAFLGRKFGGYGVVHGEDEGSVLRRFPDLVGRDVTLLPL